MIIVDAVTKEKIDNFNAENLYKVNLQTVYNTQNEMNEELEFDEDQIE
mgnify:CR=1 FL=1